VGKPNYERFYSASGDLNISSRNTISSKRRFTYSTQNCPHCFLPWKTCQDSCTACTAQLNNTSKYVPNPCCTNSPVQLTCSNKRLNKCASICMQLGCLEICTLLSLLYYLYGLYSTAHFISQQFQQVFTQKFLGKCAQSLLGKVPSLLPSLSFTKLSQKSLKLLVLHTTLGILL
jgi:hypothetical protein